MKLYPKIILTALLLLLFKGPIESLFSTILVEPIFSKLTRSIATDVAAFGIVGMGLYFMKGKWEKIKIPQWLLISAYCLIGSYLLFYRVGIIDSPWELYSTFIFSWLKYADLFVILPTISVLIIQRKYVPNCEVPKRTADYVVEDRDLKHIPNSEVHKQENPVNQRRGFFEDRPINQKDHDDLGLRPYAKALAKKIKDTTPESSFAIGINGLWGAGKTSFLDCVCANLDDKDFLQIRFNPWNSNSPNAIVNDFFMTFQQYLKEEEPDISKKILNYGNRLVELSSNFRFKFIVDLFRSIYGVHSVDSIHSEISKDLRNFDKRIIIVIDDVDRLNNNEVIEVLRLIRNTANFPRVFFLVAYDREYLVNSLRSVNPHGKDRYVEKIFQLEINLPFYKKRVLREKLLERIKQVTPDNIHNELTETLLGSDNSLPVNLEEHLTSMRDVTRLANSIALNFQKLREEVEFVDFIRIEVVRLKYPMLYSLIRDYPEDYFVLINSEYDKYGKLYVLGAKQNRNIPQTEVHGSIIKSALYKDFIKYYGDYPWLTSAVEFIHEIFGSEELINMEGVVSRKSIRDPSVFPLYFTYKLLPGYFSKGNFQKARKTGKNELEKFIRDSVEDGLEFSLAKELSAINNFESQADFENIISGIFYFSQLKSSQTDKILRETVYFPADNLYDKLMNRGNILALKYYAGDSEKLKQFLTGLFTKAKPPFVLGVDLLKIANEKQEAEFVFNQEELNALGLSLLNRAIAGSKGWNDRILDVYFALKIKDKEKMEIPSDAKIVFQNYLNEKGLEGYIFLSIIPKQENSNPYSLSNEYVFSLSDEYMETWSHLDYYTAFLKQGGKRNSEYVEEYLRFIEKWKDNGRGYIPFGFKHIPVNEKIEITRATQVGDLEKVNELKRKFKEKYPLL